MRPITTGIRGRKDHQAVKVKVVACALSTGHYALGTHRAHQARAEQTAAHVTRLTLMRGESWRLATVLPLCTVHCTALCMIVQ